MGKKVFLTADRLVTKAEAQPFIRHRADPFITRDGNTFYFTATVPEYDRIELRAADSVAALRTAVPRTIWTRHYEGIMSMHIWAPELHKIDGVWYIYFAAGSSRNKWEIRPYVLSCDGDPMTGSWREEGQMKAADGDPYSFTDFSLDATVFEHKDSHYIIWAEKVGRRSGISNLYIARLATPTKLATVQVLLTTPDYDWERIGFWVNEGPNVLKRNGKIFVTYSASATGAEYGMGMLSADENDDLLDPRVWKKSRYPVLHTDNEMGYYGPGHNSFVTDETGRDLLVFHARTIDHLVAKDPLDDPNRHTFLLPIEYDAEGAPVFNFQKNSLFAEGEEQ